MYMYEAIQHVVYLRYSIDFDCIKVVWKVDMFEYFLFMLLEADEIFL